MPELLLGIDVGTYSSKGVLVGLDGTILRSSVVEHEVSMPRAGWAEQDAEAVWGGDVVALCGELLDGDPYRGTDVAAVSVSAIGPCMVPLDRHGRPVRPGILYGVDTRATREIADLETDLGEDAIFSSSGMTLSSQAVGPKVMWMRRHEPDLWRTVTTVTTATSYLTFRLTGEHVIDRHTASHFVPLSDVHSLDWSDRWRDHVLDGRTLPRQAWSDQVCGAVTAAAAEETALVAGTPVAVGAVDALAEAISVGVVEPGDLMIMYGSTTFFILVLEDPRPDRRLWTVAGAFEGQYNIAAGMATTGSLTRWFRDQLAGGRTYADLFEEAARVEPGAGGLLALPYFSGERTPRNDPGARGVIAGLSLSTTPGELFRALLEGVGYGVRHNLETFADLGAPIQKVVAVGGGTEGRLWPQIVTDICGVPQVIPRTTVGASYGDAFLAGRAAGLLDPADIGSWVTHESTVEPAAGASALYDQRYRDFLSLYDRTRDIVGRLSS